MKRKLSIALNIAVFLLLIVLNIVSATEYGTNNDDWFIVALAGLCFIFFVLGAISPGRSAKMIHKICTSLYKHSPAIQMPSEVETCRTFKRRMPFLLLTTNILLVLLLCSIRF